MIVDKELIAERKAEYGNNFPLIADLWNNFLGSKIDAFITPEDVSIMMALMKISRLANSPMHKDSLTDLINYFYIATNYDEYVELQPKKEIKL